MAPQTGVAEYGDVGEDAGDSFRTWAVVVPKAIDVRGRRGTATDNKKRRIIWPPFNTTAGTPPHRHLVRRRPCRQMVRRHPGAKWCGAILAPI